MAAELYIDNGPSEGKTYVDLSCLEPPEMKQVHMENLGKMSWEVQWRQFLAEKRRKMQQSPITLGDNEQEATGTETDNMAD